MPNTLSDLNQYANTSVVYQDDRDYSITFSANATANTSSTIDEDQVLIVPTGIDITSVISQPGNIVYTVSGSTANIVASWPTPLPLGISNTSPGNGVYSITGIFDGVTWSQAKQLALVAPDRETTFTFVGNIQYPNPANTAQTSSWSWSNSVDIANTNPDLTLTTSYNWAEDTPTTFVYSIDDLDPSATYTLTFDQYAGTPGIITVNGTPFGIGNTATVTGNRAAVNSAAVVFNPYPDAVDAVNVYVSAVKSNPFGNVTFADNTITALNCNSTHEDYSLTTAYDYAEDSDTVDLEFEILDTDTTATNYTVTIDQVTGSTTGVFFVNGVSQGIGNAVQLSNSKANINAANVAYLPAVDYSGNIGLQYSQSKTTPLFGNVTQVSNVSIALTNTSAHEEYAFQTTGTYDESTLKSFANLVTDIDSRASSYTISLQQTIGDIGKWYVNGGLVGNASTALIFSNSKANINSVNIEYLPALSQTGNIAITYNQSKINSVFGNVIQANNIVGNYSVGNVYPEIANMIDRTVNANTVSNIFDSDTPYIDDGSNLGQIYTITLSSPRGNFGNSAANALISNTYTFTGNTSSVNSQFAGLVFVPIYEATSGSFTYTQSRDSVSQANITANLTINSSNITPETYTFTANSTFTPTFEQVYFGNARILTVGGGGSGNAYPNTTPFNNKPGSGGGAGGAVVEVVLNRNTANALVQSSYDIVVGSGGNTKGANGSNSYLSRSSTQYFVAQGGRGGVVDPDNLSPWVSPGGNTFDANGNVILGGASITAISDSVKLGGGGAGAGAVGENADAGTPVDAVGAKAGDGGIGIASNISGNSTYYGGGGGGAAGWGSVLYPDSPPGIGVGGLGGGGSGARTTGPAIDPTPGTNGLGGGGGGGLPGTSESQYRGGNGVVIINIS